MGAEVADSIRRALTQQTVVVAGADKADLVIATLAEQLIAVRAARARLDDEFTTELARHPAGAIVQSMPGIGPKTAATILVEVGDIRGFSNPGRLAVYTGVAPRTTRSGSSIRGERQHSGGNT